MGETDRKLKDYFADNRRYADLWNGSLFKGKQLICPDQLQDANSVVTFSKKDKTSEFTCDLAMKQVRGEQTLALWVLENQQQIDYSIPARILVEEALRYGQQLREIRSKNKRIYSELNSDNQRKKYYKDSGEFLYHFRAQDRLYPIITLVAYWGEENWKGPMTLHEMLDFGKNKELKEELLKLVPEFPIHFVNLSRLEDYNVFQTELKTLLELYSCRKDKEKFYDYIRSHNECQYLDEETCHMLGFMTQYKQLQTLKPQKKEETINMFTAITDLIQDGRDEGKREGKREGRIEGKKEGKREGMRKGMRKGKKEGEQKALQLTEVLLTQKRLDDLQKAIDDIDFRNQLFREFNIS